MDKAKVYKFLTENDLGSVLLDAPMFSYTTWKIGGNAEILYIPSSREKLSIAKKYFYENNIKNMVIGNGSNLLVSDEGISGVVILMDKPFANWEHNDNIVRAESGLKLALLCFELAKLNLTGLEWAVGIPGSIGGAVFMNAGAYGSHISNYIEQVEVMNEMGEIKTLFPNDLSFSYRSSGIKKGEIVLSVTLKLENGDGEKSLKEMKELLQTRANNQPLDYPSCGSVFINPEGDHAGRLVEASGCKGMQVGGAKVSEKHGNFIINVGGAKASDVLELIEQVRTIVFEKFGIKLETEVRYIK